MELNMPQLLAAAMDQVRNAVVITDADFTNNGPHVVFCNPAFLTLTGYDEQEIVGINLKILQGPETDPTVIAHLRECLKNNEYFEGQTINHRKDGSPYIVQWSISPVFDDAGKVTNYVSVQQDVSARLRAEFDRDMLAEALAVVADPVMVTGPSTRDRLRQSRVRVNDRLSGCRGPWPHSAIPLRRHRRGSCLRPGR